MKKKQKIIVVTILFVLGVSSITLSLENFFFTTQYYKTPLLAYNADCTYDIVYGDTKVQKGIGVFNFDSENCLFIGELNNNYFVVAEMSIKNEEYAFKGISMIYDVKGISDGINSHNQTNTLAGQVTWSILYNQSEISTLSNVNSVESYTLSNGYTIYVVVYND